MNPVIKRSMNVINNLLGYLEASRAKSKDGTMPLAYARNRCLNHIEKINGVPGDEKTPYLREAWGIYMKLQNFKAPSGERQDYDVGREIPLDNMDEDELWTDGRQRHRHRAGSEQRRGSGGGEKGRRLRAR